MPINVFLKLDPVNAASISSISSGYNQIPSGCPPGRFASYTEGDPFVESPPVLGGGGGVTARVSAMKREDVLYDRFEKNVPDIFV